MPSSRRLLALLSLRSRYSWSFEKVLSWRALCADFGWKSLVEAAEGRGPGNARDAPEFALYLASDSRTLTGGEPSDGLARILSAFVREGGRWPGGGRGLELK